MRNLAIVLPSSLVMVLQMAATPREAAAQYAVPAEATRSGEVALGAEASSSSRPRRTPLCEVGGSLNFVTADESPLQGQELRFTDVVLLRTHFAFDIGERLQLFAGADVLPKQPSDTTELVWQGALLGARYRFSDVFGAWARGHVRPMLDRSGIAMGGSAAVDSTVEIEDWLRWVSALGMDYLALTAEDDGTPPPSVLEVLARTGLTVTDDRHFSVWLTFTYDYPVWSRSEAAADPTIAAPASDSQPRMNVDLGGSVLVTDTFGLFAQASILDRGDVDDPGTTLPVLNGGFDQAQLIFGFVQNFERGPDGDDDQDTAEQPNSRRSL